MNARLDGEPIPNSGSSSPIWLASLAGLVVVSVLFASGMGFLLRISIPACTVLVGLAFYFCRPVAYLHLTLWTWLLTPFMRRLVDWRVGFEDHNLVLITPLLVSAIAGITVIRERRSIDKGLLAPLYFCVAGIVYGFSVGIIRWYLHISTGASIGEICYALFDWLAPLLFGMHLVFRWKQCEEHKQALQLDFLFGLLVLGAYGVYQFISPPAWDLHWLEHMIADVSAESFGRPEAFQVRIWSTLNSPGAFGMFLMAALLLLFSSNSRIRFLAAGFGYSAFILTLVRSCWLGWVIGLAVLARNSSGKQISRLFASLLLLPFLVLPLMLNPAIANLVTERAGTLQSTRQDESFRDRAEEYRVLLVDLAEDPFGEGLSNATRFHGYIMDSGIILLLCSFGWVGAALFLLGVAMCGRNMPSGRSTKEPFLAPCYAVFVAMMAEQLSGNTFVGPSGFIFWACAGLSLSYRRAEQSSSVLTVHSLHNSLQGRSESVLMA